MHLGAEKRSFQIFPPKCGMGLGLAGKASRDLFWAATYRMPEIGKACRKHKNGLVRSPWH